MNKKRKFSINVLKTLRTWRVTLRQFTIRVLKIVYEYYILYDIIPSGGTTKHYVI